MRIYQKGCDEALMEIHAFQKLADNADFFENSQNSQDSRNPMNPGAVPGCDPPGLQPQPMTVFPDVTPPGMAYVPYQLWSNDTYDPEKGLQQGTVFPVLDLPFSPQGGDCM